MFSVFKCDEYSSVTRKISTTWNTIYILFTETPFLYWRYSDTSLLYREFARLDRSSFPEQYISTIWLSWWVLQVASCAVSLDFVFELIEHLKKRKKNPTVLTNSIFTSKEITRLQEIVLTTFLSLFKYSFDESNIIFLN